MIQVLFEDNHLLVLNKPFGLLTQPTEITLDSLENRGKAWLKEKYNKPFNVFLNPIHRLDRVAGGIVVFAKTSKALSRLGESMRERAWKKTYRIRTDVLPKKSEGRLEHFLVHDDHKALVSLNGKQALLSYVVKPSGMIEVNLETGRYHQIRAQFAAIGCPIVGDIKYGAREDGRERILLQHYSCAFPHPISKEEFYIELPHGLVHKLLT
jgi:23S rRNA pseudouridine1911/1915/1917 synthase